MSEGPDAITPAIARLYAGLHRPRPAVLIARSPAEFARLALAAARPVFYSQVSLLAIWWLLVPLGYLTAFGAGYLWYPEFFERLSAFWPYGVFLGLYLGISINIFEGQGVRVVPVWLDVVPSLVLFGGAALLAFALFGTPNAIAIAVMLGAFLIGTYQTLRAPWGSIGARLALRRRRGMPVPVWGGSSLQPVLADRLQAAVETLGPATRSGQQTEPEAVAREAARRILLLLDRPRWVEKWRHAQAPCLGQGVNTGTSLRARGFTPSADLPNLVRAVQEVDRSLVAVSLFEGCAVVLPHGTEPAMAGSPIEVMANLMAPEWLLRALRHLPEGPALWMVARMIDLEPDPVLRLEAILALGPDRVARALRRRPIAEDGSGALFAFGPALQPSVLVRVADRVLDADGNATLHWLPVPPHLTAPREAVAWTFGKSERDYAPLLES